MHINLRPFIAILLLNSSVFSLKLVFSCTSFHVLVLPKRPLFWPRPTPHMTTYLLFGQRSGLEQKFSWFTHPRPENFLTSPRVVWNNFKTTHIHHRICSSPFSRGYCQWKYLHQKWIRSCHFWFFVWRDNRPPPPNFSDSSCKPPCFQQIHTNKSVSTC